MVVGSHHYRPEKFFKPRVSAPTANMANHGPGNFGNYQPKMMANGQNLAMGNMHVYPHLGNRQVPPMGYGQANFTNNIHSSRVGDFMNGNQALLMNGMQMPPMGSNQVDLMNFNNAALMQNNLMANTMNFNHAAAVGNMQNLSMGNDMNTNQSIYFNGMQMSDMGNAGPPAIPNFQGARQQRISLRPTAPAFVPNQNNMLPQQAVPLANMHQQPFIQGQMQQPFSPLPTMNMPPQITGLKRPFVQANAQQGQRLQPHALQMHQRSMASAPKGNARPKRAKQPAKRRVKQPAQAVSEPQPAQVVSQPQPPEAIFEQQPAQDVSEPQPSVSQTATPVSNAEATRVVSIEKGNGYLGDALYVEPSGGSQQGDLMNFNAEPQGSLNPAGQVTSGFLASAPVSSPQAANPPVPAQKVTKKTKAKQVDKAKSLDEAEAAGIPVPPSQRRFVTLSRDDPRVTKKNGKDCAPPSDAYSSNSSSFFPPHVSQHSLLTMPAVYLLGPEAVTDEAVTDEAKLAKLAGLKKVAGNLRAQDGQRARAQRVPNPPSETVTSKKKRKYTEGQMKEAAIEYAYDENEKLAQSNTDESFTDQPPTAQTQAAPVAQPNPDESFASQLPADDETMPGLTFDSGSDAQPSPALENFPGTNEYGSQDMVNDNAGDDYLNFYPPLPSGDAKIGLQIEPATNQDNSLTSAIIDPPTADLDNPVAPFTTVSAGWFIDPISGTDLWPLAEFLGSNDPPSDQLPPGLHFSHQLPSDQLPSDQLPSGQLPSGQLPSDQLPSEQAAQFEVDPSLFIPAEDDVGVSVQDPNMFTGESHRYAPASPESAFEDA